MQIKEFEGFTLKECLQQVRTELGPDAVILETRKFRKGGILGIGAKDAVCIVAALGITVQNDLPSTRNGNAPGASPMQTKPYEEERPRVAASKPKTPAKPDVRPVSPVSPTQAAAVAAARSAYGKTSSTSGNTRLTAAQPVAKATSQGATALLERPVERVETAPDLPEFRRRSSPEPLPLPVEQDRMNLLERALQEIRDGLFSLQREQKENQERTITAVVSAVSPAVSAVTNAANLISAMDIPSAHPEIYNLLVEMGVSVALAQDFLDSLPDMSAWGEDARHPLALAAVKDLISRRVQTSGSIALMPGSLKAVALIGPTGVGKTTTIAKLAAHYALVEKKKVGLLTVDTYRIAAVEQLKTYSQIIDIPVGVAYTQADVLPAVAQFKDFDLLLIDTAGRSQKNIMQVGELKAMLETLRCETHLVLSAQTKESDMIEAAERFSAARVDRLLFSKLDETSSYGTLLNVADKTGIPLSYFTVGQKVPEDIEVADGKRLADLILENVIATR